MQNRVYLMLAAVVVTVGTVLGLTITMDAQALAEPWTREAYRIVFFHMPLAWAGCIYFMAAAVHSGRYLAGRDLRADRAAYGAAELGLVLLVLATVTGMVFAKTQWGAWWNWDPRQTSVFFVLLIYAAYLMLRQALPEDEALRARIGAAYLLLALVPMIYLVGVFPRTGVQSLHPVKPPLDPIHWRIILMNFAGLLCLGGAIRGLQDGTARVLLSARETPV